jgi:hypothetical protein
MTYLDLINSVLRRLRENTVDTSAETTYSAMIGDLVNDAKTTIEQSHQWTALRSTVVFPTVESQVSYSLTGAGQASILHEAMNDTSNWSLRQKTKNYLNDQTYFGEAPNSAPTDFIWNGTDSDGDLQIDLFPTPDGIYSLRFDLVIPQATLASDATKLEIPSFPVVQLAFGMALRERGETGGQSAVEQFSLAGMALSDAIQIDANKYQNEITFVAV